MVAELASVPTRTFGRSSTPLTSPRICLVVNADVTLAVKTAIVMIETTIQIIASALPAIVIGPRCPVLACVIASADHQMLAPNPRPTVPPKS